MNKLDASITTPGRMTMLALLVAGLAQTGFAAAATPVTTPNHLVISQVYGGGGNTSATYKNDFVELFNPTSSAIVMSNWTLQYAATTNTANAWGIASTLNGTVAPGGYYLVKLASGGSPGVDLPTAEGSSSTNISATTGKVALVKSTTALVSDKPLATNIVDLIGYGTATAFEGAVATAPSGGTVNTNALFRVNGGCADTDNNAADFVIGASAPRNSGSPVNSCVVAPIVLTCPSSFALAVGTSGSTSLTAIGTSSIVNSASISGGATAGIALAGFSGASDNGGTASVNLSVSAAVAAGTYPIAVTFSNNNAETSSCTVSVQVQAAAGTVTHTIPQIQGAGATSPYVNTVQTTEGVVTRTLPNGYFIQDVNGDGDPTTSDAILVYMNTVAYTPVVGDLVRVTATVSEFTPTGAARSTTELITPTAVSIVAKGRSVVPTNISFADVISGAVTLARYEGMLVNVVDTLTVNHSQYLPDRGELVLGIGRNETATNRFRPATPERAALAAANLRNQLVLDDGFFVDPLTVPYIGQDTTVRVGDTVTGLTGVVDFGAAGGGTVQFKIQPTIAPIFSRSNPRTEAPSFAGANVKVASANVLNFFSVFTDGTNYLGATVAGCTVGATTNKGNCRGADNLAEYVRQRDKIVNELKGIDADVFGLMEIQNDGDATVKVLVDALNVAIGSTTYAVVPGPASRGTDAIRVAMIYKPSKLTLSGSAMSDGDSVNNRAPFAQTFTAPNGGKFSLIVNHLKSKGSCDTSAGNTDAGDGQGCWNATRVAQATRLAQYFVPQVVSAGGTPNVLIIGDLNSYGMEDPIQTLINNGFTNQLERFVRPTGLPYSYVFNGESGYLDHALASAALQSQVVGAAEWHNNADEPEVTDYNFDGKPGSIGKTGIDPAKDLYVNNAYRASDHDPVVIGLALAAPTVDLTSSFTVVRSGLAVNRVTGKNTGTITFTNTSGAPVSGPFQVQFDRLTLGISIDGATGTHNGAPYITVTPGTIAPGASFTMPITLNNPGRLNIGYSTTIFSGNF